jgi:hypothetical protein
MAPGVVVLTTTASVMSARVVPVRPSDAGRPVQPALPGRVVASDPVASAAPDGASVTVASTLTARAATTGRAPAMATHAGAVGRRSLVVAPVDQ